MKKFLASLLTLAALLPDGSAATLFDRGASWRWKPGTSEASTPIEAWRAIAFDDSSFTAAPSPFWFGDVLPGGTQITGMSGVYSSLYMRKTFVVNNVAEIAGLRLGTLVDDGYVAWINGTEVRRVNMAGAAGTAVAFNTLANNATEPVPFEFVTLANPALYLVPGTNVIAVQVFQSSLGSSDLGFDASLESILIETVPPVVSTLSPAAGATITNLTEITVTFSEEVTGVDSGDLRINGVSATTVTPVSTTAYQFNFARPAYGNVTVSWNPAAGIADKALPPNPFNATGPGTTWNYTLEDRTPPVVTSLTPAAGGVTRTLNSIIVVFSEGVTGVAETDLLINNTPATGIVNVAANEYIFNFPAPATGAVQVAWAPAHGIADLATPPNAFAGGNWSYTFDPNAAEASPYISEFMAANDRTLTNDFGITSDWIEIYNPGATTVNLEGWTLTDTSNDLTKWQFPATNIAGGGFIIVFASGNDRRIPGAPLHAPFVLSASGEYLALVEPDGTIATEFRPSFPGQIQDISFGFEHFPNGSRYAAGTNSVYFTRATPGAPNFGGVTTPGPIIDDVTHTPNVPTENEDLVVTARVIRAINPVASVSVRYRVMFSNEVATTMFDDGTHGDGAAGDGIYGATIPSNISTNGQMIRYKILATDTAANTSRWPLFPSINGTAEYLGTIVEPTYVTSKLPIFHLFVSPTHTAGIDTEAGGKVAVFYDGELYDNIHMELRGNTSASQTKKSHRLEFNREHLFRHMPGFPRIQKTSLMAEFLDPAYLRQHLSFWLLDKMGIPAPFFYPVRAQLNGAFYALKYHNDVIDEEQVQRMGYDPAGALYKAAGNVLPSRSSTGVFQKKTAPLNDFTDYTEFSTAINESNPLASRRIAAFDRMDIPNVINYLAGARWCAENDDVWANMSIYRDVTNGIGDGMWRNIPFDMNASWGQRYGGITPLDATNDTCKSHPLYGGSTIIACDGGSYNRIYDVIIAVPETRQMLLRRMRTILDKWVLEPGVAPESRLLETHIRYMTNQIWTEAFLDRARWGYSTWTASNKPLTNAVDELFNQFINPRRHHWNVVHSITNTAKPIGITPTSNAGIPLSQPSGVILQITSVDYNPASTIQEQEYICLTNPASLAIDVSGWQITGGIEFTFKHGTIVPANSVIYVSPRIAEFRKRTTGPRGGQGLFVVGPYKGQLSARGETLTVLNDLGQIVNTYSYPGNPSLAQQYLRITEIMYRPSNHPANAESDMFEYIELRNISTNVNLSLAGVRFVNGVEFNFTGSAVTSLAPGARVLVVRNSSAFSARYGAGLPIAGQYSGNLNNGGERIQLLDSVNEEILDFSYNNSWYPQTDGLGFSLVVVDENAAPDTWDSRRQWRPSGSVEGAPGAADPAPGVIAPILITEALTHTDLPVVDQIELHNPTGDAVSIGGWWLSDDLFTPKKYLIPPTTIPAGGYVVFDESHFNAPGSPTGFSLGSDGDEVYLYSGDGINLTGYIEGHEFGPASTGVSFGRYINSQTNLFFTAQSAATLGSPNSGPKVGPIVISEINYRPVDLPGGQDNSIDEYIELANISGASVLLNETVQGTNTWRIRGGVDYEFPVGQTLPAGGFALLVNFNPADATTANAFRSRFNVPGSVALYGPYRGKLDNDGDNIRLLQPDVPETNTPPPYVLVDQVEYDNAAPWSVAADGVGPTLQRIVATAFGNDPTNWTAVGPSPGTLYVPGGTLPSVISQPANLTAVAGKPATFSVIASGSAPLFFQWRLNGQNLYGENGSSLTIPSVSPTDAGSYSCIIFNSAGSTVSAAATLNVVFPPTITRHPTEVKVMVRPDPTAAPSTNATFTAAASSTSPIRYQWLFNGIAITDATNATLTIVGVTTNHWGAYRCAITDNVDTVLTEPAMLYPMIQTTITVHPTPQTVAVGSLVGLSVAYTGFPPPFTNEWRRASTPIGTNVSMVPSDIITFFASAAPGTNSYRAVIKSITSSGGRPSNLTPIVTLADVDGDGIPDVIETALGLDPNNGADGAGDLDGDTMSNRAEHMAGTDPTNSLSYLKIEQSTVPGTATVSVAAVANRSYTVQYTDDLNTGVWTKLNDIVAMPADRVVQLTDPTWTSNRFYRVTLPGTR